MIRGDAPLSLVTGDEVCQVKIKLICRTVRRSFQSYNKNLFIFSPLLSLVLVYVKSNDNFLSSFVYLVLNVCLSHSPLTFFSSCATNINFIFCDNCKLGKMVTFPGVRPTKVRGSLHDSNQIPDTRNLERDSSLDSRPG